MIKQLLCACIIGFIITLAVMQQDARIKNVVGEHIKAVIAELGNCRVEGSLSRMNLFEASIELSDVRVMPTCGTDWSWQADHLHVSFSWLHILCYGSAALDIELEGFDGHSTVQAGKIPLLDHVYLFLYAPMTVMATFLETLKLKNSSITIYDPEHAATFSGAWCSESKRMGGVFKTAVYVTDGELLIGNERYMKGLHTVVGVSVPYAAGKQGLGIQGKGTMALAHAQPGQADCYVSGSWIGDTGTITLNNNDRSLRLEKCDLDLQDDGMHAQMEAYVSLEYLSQLLAKAGLSTKKVGGDCVVTAQACVRDAALVEIKGTVTCRDISCDGWRMPAPCSTTFAYTNNQWQGDLALGVGTLAEVAGAWQWRSDIGHCALHNVKNISLPLLPQWSIAPNAVVCDISWHKDGHCFGSYRGTVHDTKRNQEISINGQGHALHDAWQLSGSACDIVCTVHGTLAPAISIKEIKSVDKSGASCIQLTEVSGSAHHMAGTLSIAWINELLVRNSLDSLQGDGQLGLDISLDKNIVVKMALRDGSIRLGPTYNFIKSCDACICFDPHEKRLTVSDAECLLHKGSVSCKQAIVQFDDAYNFSFAYLPLVMNHILFNRNKDLFAILSGHAHLRYAKEDEKPQINGALLVERSHVTGNLFSELLKSQAVPHDLESLASYDAVCDVTIESQAPVRIDTPFLQTEAQVTLHIGNRLLDPDLSGSIDLVSGAILFPYKPLRITKGSILFLPHRMHDPVLEITAKNMIKRHNVTMQIVGSLKDPRIILGASPSLTDEQIISLLFVGTQEKSLSMIMPTLMVNNLANLIFGDQAPLDVTHLLKKLPTPFEHIRLIPSLSDQTIRGGLKAAIEIDINERWRAFIQRNFSLTEDTRFEVEYLISDDVMVRGIRDEHRDVGGEIEMRWKF